MMTLPGSYSPLHHNIQPDHSTVKAMALSFNGVVGFKAGLQWFEWSHV
jgi:hypothetical protein